MKIHVDGFVLTGAWIGLLGVLAFDVMTSPYPAIVFVTMIVFAVVALTGLAWRRYWRRVRRSFELEDMRRNVRRYGQKDGAA